MTDDDIGIQLAGWGKAVRIETIGWRSGQPRTVAVSYTAEPDGSLLVAAGDADADWARNLELEPRCRVEVADTSWAAIAELLDGAAAAAAIRGLILKYGTPAERLGAGPAFRLRRADADRQDPRT